MVSVREDGRATATGYALLITIMLFRYFLVGTLLLFTLETARACDACGCKHAAFLFKRYGEVELMPNAGLYIEQAQQDTELGYYRTHTGSLL